MSVLPNVTPRYLVSEQKGRVLLLWLTMVTVILKKLSIGVTESFSISSLGLHWTRR